MQFSAETTMVILLGASEFRKCPTLEANGAFGRSAEAFKEYVTDADALGVRPVNVLDLFDSELSTDKQDEAIEEFLTTRSKAMQEAKTPATDLIVYYVGHGGFTSPEDQYFLALRSTSEGREQLTGYPIGMLAKRLRETAAKLRRYLILDCCFSGSAYAAFQSGPLQAARQKIDEELPAARGTALLCASGARDPAKALPGERMTMFSGALIDVLRRGGADLPERLSLADVGERARQLIRERFTDKAVRPEVLSPEQKQGDVAAIQLFPNLGLRVKSLNESLNRLQARLDELERQPARGGGGGGEMEARLAALEKAAQALAAGAGTRGGAAASMGMDMSMMQFGIPWEQWEALPGRVKGRMFKARSRRMVGMKWLQVAMTVSVITVVLAIFSTSNAAETGQWGAAATPTSQPVVKAERSLLGRSTYAKAANGMTAGCAVVILLSVYGLSQRGDRLDREEGMPEAADRYPAVQDAYSQKWCDIFGLEIERGPLSLSLLIFVVAFSISAVVRLAAAYG